MIFLSVAISSKKYPFFLKHLKKGNRSFVYMNVNLNSGSPFKNSLTIPENVSLPPTQLTQERKKIALIVITAFGCLAGCYAVIRSYGRNFNFNETPGSPGSPDSSFIASLHPASKMDLRVQSELWRTLKNRSDAPRLNNHLRSEGLTSTDSSGSLTLTLADLTSAQGVSLYGDFHSAHIVKSAGDFNGDGFDDVIIGVPETNEEAGISYVIYGGKLFPDAISFRNLTSQQGFPIIGAKGDLSGWSVSGAGDFNGDGFDDVIVGAPYANNSGISYVIYGSKFSFSAIYLAALTSEIGFPIVGDGLGGRSGGSVSSAGDFNGDGFDDVVIGAPYGNNEAGISYVIFGNTALFSAIHLANLTVEQGFSIYGQEGQSGYSVSEAGDFNGDRFDDVIIGASLANYGAGVSYIIYGKNNSNIDNVYLTALSRDNGLFIIGAEGASGYSVSSAGDVNGDRLSDVVIGTPYANINAGISYVIYGVRDKPISISIQNLGTNGFSIAGKEGTYTGWSVSGTGNMTGGAYDDLIIGNAVGAAYIIYGSASGFITPSPTMAPTHSPAEKNDDAWIAPDGTGFHAVYTVSTFILSIVAGYFFREKIAFYILNHWGHKYKFMPDGANTELEEGEIGLRLDHETIICVVKGNSYKLHTDDNDAGVSLGLYDSLKRVLENSDITQSFTLTQHEQNQLRDFLFYHNYIKTKKICCCLKGYPELGYLKGSIYGMILSKFEEEHKIISKKQVRKVIELRVSMSNLKKPSSASNVNDDGDDQDDPVLATTKNPLGTDDRNLA